MQPRDLEAHIHPQRRIQIRQRLVEEKSLGFTDDGTADGHTLALSAGQLFRQPVQQRLEPQDLCNLCHTAVDF